MRKSKLDESVRFLDTNSRQLTISSPVLSWINTLGVIRTTGSQRVFFAARIHLWQGNVILLDWMLAAPR
jgi:hypothetical protein